MSRVFEDLAIFVACGSPLTRPNHAFTSINQLARRSRAGSDDKLRRTLARLEQAMNDPLIQTEGRRLVLTEVGCQLLTHSERLLAIGKGRPEAEPVEFLNVAVADSVGVLAHSAADFLAEWNGLVGLRFHTLDAETVQEQIAAGSVAFGLGWAADDIMGTTERLEPGFMWQMLVPSTHRLAESAEPLTGDQLGETERVIVPPLGAASAQVNEFLASVPPANRIDADCSETVREFVASGLGIGLDITGGTERCAERLCWRPVAGLEPEYLCLYLPRHHADKLSAPALFMVDAVRRTVQGAGAIVASSTQPVREEANTELTTP